MSIRNIEDAIRKRMSEMQEDIFRNPPSDYLEFRKRLGVWNGLGEALKIIQDARKDDDDD